jgi:hypothetical protein
MEKYRRKAPFIFPPRTVRVLNVAEPIPSIHPFILPRGGPGQGRPGARVGRDWWPSPEADPGPMTSRVAWVDKSGEVSASVRMVPAASPSFLALSNFFPFLHYYLCFYLGRPLVHISHTCQKVLLNGSAHKKNISTKISTHDIPMRRTTSSPSIDVS